MFNKDNKDTKKLLEKLSKINDIRMQIGLPVKSIADYKNVKKSILEESSNKDANQDSDELDDESSESGGIN